MYILRILFNQTWPTYGFLKDKRKKRDTWNVLNIRGGFLNVALVLGCGRVLCRVLYACLTRILL